MADTKEHSPLERKIDAGAQTRPVNGTDTVTIACKFPAGIIMRVVAKLDDYKVPQPGGGYHMEQRAVFEDRQFKIAGPATEQGISPTCEVQGGFALTHGIPREFAERWFAQNKSLPMVQNGVIFMASSSPRAADEAKEKRKTLSGLERLDIGTVFKEGVHKPRDPRWPTQMRKNVSNVETDDRAA